MRYEKSQKNNKSNTTDHSIKSRKTTLKLIYINQLEGRISTKIILLIIFLLVLETELSNTFYACGLEGLDFWMFQLYFINYMISTIFNKPIYAHHKYSMFFVLIVCSLMKLISFYLLYNDDREKIYKTYNLLIPIGFVFYLLIIFLRSYAICKMKWLLDLKYISSIKIFMYYGLIGMIFCFLSCIITSLYPCGDTIISYKEMIKICRFEQNITKTEIYHYYDNYLIYFDHLLEGDILTYCILSLRIIINFLTNLLSILIIQNLNPAIFICSGQIYYFIYTLLNIFIFLGLKEEIKSYAYIDFFIEIFALFGTLVYIELIELNFCDLSYNLKKNIILRSILDSKTSNNNETTTDISKVDYRKKSEISLDTSLFE
jgi:hypothetical protein